MFRQISLQPIIQQSYSSSLRLMYIFVMDVFFLASIEIRSLEILFGTESNALPCMCTEYFFSSIYWIKMNRAVCKQRVFVHTCNSIHTRDVLECRLKTLQLCWALLTSYLLLVEFSSAHPISPDFFSLVFFMDVVNYSLESVLFWFDDRFCWLLWIFVVCVVDIFDSVV